MDTYSRSIKGAQSRSSGAYFEGMIEAASRFYEERGISVIDKTPEPVKVLAAHNRSRGQFICCFAKQAQPDYKGILCDSTMILFDAKHTDKERIGRDCVTQEQEECFERYMKHGAMCFLVVSIGFEKFYRVPWVVFRDMKKIYGHKYMNEVELEPYQVTYKNGILRFLDGVELKGKENDDEG
jgi:recombination protein U